MTALVKRGKLAADLKMKIGFGNRIGLMTLMVMSGMVVAWAEEPTRSRGTPVIFSGPKSDAVSTNLNDLQKSAKPLQDLETQLKQSFQSLDGPRTEPSFRESRRIQQQAQPLNRQTLKADLNRRAEDMFLNPELYDAGKEEEAFFQLDKNSLDPNRKTAQTSLEQFDKRQQSERAALTNRASSDNLFGGKNIGRPNEFKPDSKFVKPLKSELFNDGAAGESLTVFPRAATNSSARSEERSSALRNSETFNRALEDPIARQRSTVETRMEDFKRLLEGPRYKPSASALSGPAAAPGNYNVMPSANLATTPAARTAATPNSTTDWSAFKSTSRTEAKPDFAKSAGLVGSPEKLQAFPEFPAPTATLEPTKPVVTPPAPLKKNPTATFKLPKRGF